MKLLPRFTTANAVMVNDNNGNPYSTGYYDTHIKPADCCGKNPDLYAGAKINGFLKGSEYEFVCGECERVGGRYQTANGAAAMWNRTGAQPIPSL